MGRGVRGEETKKRRECSNIRDAKEDPQSAIKEQP
jgi:hypothetical protein